MKAKTYALLVAHVLLMQLGIHQIGGGDWTGWLVFLLNASALPMSIINLVRAFNK